MLRPVTFSALGGLCLSFLVFNCLPLPFSLAQQSVNQNTRIPDLDDARALYNQGKYDLCIAMTRSEVERGVWHDGWAKLLMRTLLTKGQYAEALAVYRQVSEKFSGSLPLRLLAVEALRFAGQPNEARTLLTELQALIAQSPWRFTDRENLLAFGSYELSRGRDPRQVLTQYYDRVLKSDPKYVEAHIAIAELALGKNDFQESANALKLAEKLAPADPQIQYLLAKTWAPSDSVKATQHLQKALELNPQHVDSLLLECDELLDGEQLDDADKLIDEVLKINPLQSKAWSLRAVINHLRGQYREEGECRAKALSTWPQNPEVDYEIGRKLSRFYRFADAVQYLRRAVSLDANFMPARFQLAQDLLRLGETDEGWTMVDQVNAADKYNVVASNLDTLRERLAQFTTLQHNGFIVRMDRKEAEIYGGRVLKLLGEAKEVLSKKYDHKLEEPINVEIFPQQSDFAIRTFGLPGGAGYLGVCFGKLITANSPASQGETPSNWESVLWHEFCHVVTLQKTANRMPRWLSEGISVYEELERDPSWGQSMNPTYRKMILGEDFVPLSKLSSAFLQPKTSMHLQFAYFESSLAVRYMVERHGLERLKKLLVDLGLGIPMHDALARIYGDSAILDKDFQAYCVEAANKLYSQQPDEDVEVPPRTSLTDLEKLVADHPQHYAAARQLAGRYLANQIWDKALPVLLKLDQAWPNDAEAGGVLDQLASVYRKLEKAEDEEATLKRIFENSSDNLPAITRLIEIARSHQSWDEVDRYAQRLMAVQPLITLGHTALVEAANQRGDQSAKVEALSALLQLDPIDAGRLNYELAEAEFGLGQVERARQHVLMTLEETPRYRAAQNLLLKIVHQRSENHSDPTRTVNAPDDGQPPSPDADEKRN